MNLALELLPKKARDAASRQWREDMGGSFNITERLCRAIHAANTAIGLSPENSSEVEEGLLGSAAKEALLRSREARHVSPPERGSEDWQCWEGDAEEDLAAVAAALTQPVSPQPDPTTRLSQGDKP